MAKNDYFHEISYPDPFPDLYETGSDGERTGYEEAQPLDRCDYGVHAPRKPSGVRDCNEAAIAKIVHPLSDRDDAFPVCHEHLEKIMEGARRRGNCICEWDDDDMAPELIENSNCQVDHD